MTSLLFLFRNKLILILILGFTGGLTGGLVFEALALDVGTLKPKEFFQIRLFYCTEILKSGPFLIAQRRNKK